MGNLILKFEGNRNGIGKAKFLNASIYSGEFKDGRRNGKGEIVYYYSGNKYVGEYRNMKKHGNGILYNSKNEIIYSGRWENGFPCFNYSRSRIRSDSFDSFDNDSFDD